MVPSSLTMDFGVARLGRGGNRRQLRLTTRGAQLVERCGRLLEGRFEELVRRSGVPYGAYQRHTRRLLQLEPIGDRPWTSEDGYDARPGSAMLAPAPSVRTTEP